MKSILNNCDDTNIFLEYQLEGVFVQLEKSIKNNQNIYIGVSGGSDSMLVLVIIFMFYKKTGYSVDNITVLHYNHKQRKESDSDELFVKNRCYKHNIDFVSACYRGGSHTEQYLRRERWGFFHNILRHGGSDSVFLSGHHLDDRIETSILNLIRGCGEKGFYNMSLTKNCLYRDDSDGILQYVYIRPLLSFTKKMILELCKKLRIDYVEDITNTNPDISQRNKLRVYLSGKGPTIIPLFTYLYTQKSCNKSKVIFRELKVFDTTVLGYYKVLYYTTISDVYKLLEFVGGYKNITQGYMLELDSFIRHGSGMKKIGNWSLVKAHGEMYILLTKNDFWDTSRIDNLGGVLYHKKSISRRYIKEKVPFFLRNSSLVRSMGYAIDTPIRRRIFEEHGYL